MALANLTPRNSLQRRSDFKKAQTAMKDAEFAILDGQFERALILSQMATAYATMSLYDGAE